MFKDNNIDNEDYDIEDEDYSYDVEEDDRDYEREGLTDAVTPYSYVDEEYPNIILDVGNNALPKYKVESLTVMVSAKISPDEEDNMINLYLRLQNNIMKLGKIHKRQVVALAKLFKDYKIVGNLDKNTVLTDDLIYILA